MDLLTFICVLAVALLSTGIVCPPAVLGPRLGAGLRRFAGRRLAAARAAVRHLSRRSLPRFDSSYRISALIGLLTYFAYGSLNDAWSNPALFGVALYMFLAVPWYSRLSNQVEARASRVTCLITGGRAARYLLQLAFNLALLWVLLASEILAWSGLEGIGGFFGAAAWVTVLSQGGQYLAAWLACNGIGHADRNVVIAICASATTNALAVSGVSWIQSAYVITSLCFGTVMLLMGVLADTRFVLQQGMRSK